MIVHVIQKWMIELLDEKLDDFCLFLFYIETNQLESSNIGWLLHIMKKIIQV